MDVAAPQPAPQPASRRALLQVGGVLIFLFIPLVLFLFVKHPQPVGFSLTAGILLMMGHRFLARPYMRWSVPIKCLWCNRLLDDLSPNRRQGEATTTLELHAGGRRLAARCCARHRLPAAKFFSFLHLWRWPLRMGIFVPLAFLLVALAAAAAGQRAPVPLATAWFRLVVGSTVNLAALGYLIAREQSPLDVPFPVHNFFLLGVRNLLWILRGVGLWWIWQGLSYVFGP